MVRAAAKCMILMVKLGKKTTKYVLGVVPGDARIDLNAVKALLGGRYISFASADIAEWPANSAADYRRPANPRLERISQEGPASG